MRGSSCGKRLAAGGALAVSLLSAGAGAKPGSDPWLLPLESRVDPADIVARNSSVATFTREGTLSVRGARLGEHLVLLDGFRLDRPARVPLSGVADLTLATVALEPALADVPGGALHLRTRTPGDTLVVGLDASRLTARQWPYQLGEHEGTGLHGFIAGPLVGRRVRQLIAWGLESTEFSSFAANTMSSQLRTASVLFRLDVSVHPRHEIDLLALGDFGRGEGGSTARDPLAQPAYDARGGLLGARWRGRLGSSVVASSQLSLQRSLWDQSSLLCFKRGADCRHVPSVSSFGIQSENIDHHGLRHEDSLDLSTQVSGSGTLGPSRHRLRLTSRLRARRTAEARSAPGDHILRSDMGGPPSRTDVFTALPLDGEPRRGWSLYPARALSAVHAIESQIRFGERVQVIPGLAVVTARARGPEVKYADVAWAPSASAAIDLTGARQLWLHGSSGLRYHDDVEGRVRLDGIEPITLTCRQDNVPGRSDGGCTLQGGGPGRTGAPRGATRLPRTREHALGLGSLLGPGLLRVELVYRKTTDMVDIEPLASSPLAGPGLLLEGAAGPRPVTAAEAGDPSDWRRYLGATISGGARWRGLDAELAYTRASVTNDNGRDRLADREHVVRLLARYAYGDLFSLGVVFRADSGLPYARLYRTDSGTWLRRHPVGQGPGHNPNDPQALRELRLPWSRQLNLQLRANARRLFPEGLGRNLELFVDLINLLEDDAITSVQERDGIYHGLVTSMQEPRWARFGLSYRY